ncbi:T9SS type A sorting domain-containing protein [Bacteroidota bacterium]
MKRHSLLIFLAILPVFLYSQGVSIYTVSRYTGITFSSIAATGTSVSSWRGGPNTGDNRSFPVPLGFTFYYLGANYTTVNISLNGFIDFSSNPATGVLQFPYGYDNNYFTQTSPNGTLNAIAPFYEDLMCSFGWSISASVKYETSGSLGSRVFTVEWINMTYPIAPYTETVNFQVKLYEADGDIEFIYGNMGAAGIPLIYTSGINTASLSTPPGSTELLTQQDANSSNFSNLPKNNLSEVPLSMSKILFAGCILPSPAGPISGPTDVCQGTAGLSYSITPLFNTTFYNWTLPPGFTITGGVMSSTIFVNAAVGASSGTITVNGTNACGDGTIATLPVTVFARPTPTITGPVTACAGSAGHVYSTEAGMSSYQWTISSGGTIQSGSGTNTVTVTWDSAGSRSISVNYANAPGCEANTPVNYPVTVLPQPVPTINGDDSVCVGSTGNTYTTDAGMTNYQWTVSSGGVITDGGNSTSNFITITWNSIGNQTVSVSYSNANDCTPTAPKVFGVLVSSIPTPQIFGPNAVCAQSAGNSYTTQPGMSSYSWTVSSGGSITSTTDTNVIEVTWNFSGIQHVIVNYTTPMGCAGEIPDTMTVTVNSRPTPTISGPASVCESTGGHLYTTEPSNSGYEWLLSEGGTIVSGIGTNAITVTWDSAGSRQVMVNYSNSSSCNALTPTSFAVAVKPRPIPTITGPSPVCKGISGSTYTTESGMLDYTWDVSAGNTTTAGGTTGDNFITVTWNVADTQYISVNYTATNGCTAQTAASYPVMVNTLPVPTIGGPDTLCINTSGHIYGTQPGMFSYAWIVSAGGTITSGAGTDTIAVAWNQSGAQTVSVNYNDSNGCTAAAPVVYDVNVLALPVPTITGPASACLGTSGITYTTESGMTDYQWVVSNGGTVTAGGNDSVNYVTVTWDSTGAQTVSVGYTNSTGCTTSPLFIYTITVHPLPVPTITGESIACTNAGNSAYSTETGMTGYLWTTSASGQITSGQGTSQVQVTWLAAGSQWVGVNYTNGDGCTADTASTFTVSVDGPPGQVGAVSGTDTICGVATGVSYSVDSIANANAYNWTIPPGAILTSGAGTTSILVDYPETAISGNVTVTASNACGNGAASPPLAVTITQIPNAPEISQAGDVLISNVLTGNQWIRDGNPIPGATGSTYLALEDGEYWDLVIINTCESDPSNHIYVVVTGIDEISTESISLYPNPNDGTFTLRFNQATDESYDVAIVNQLGSKVTERKIQVKKGKTEHQIDFRPLPAGVYTVVISGKTQRVVRKIVVN